MCAINICFAFVFGVASHAPARETIRRGDVVVVPVHGEVAPSLLAMGTTFVHAAINLPAPSMMVVTQQRLPGWSVDGDLLLVGQRLQAGIALEAVDPLSAPGASRTLSPALVPSDLAFARLAACRPRQPC